jgi:hypothetical protein
MAALGLLLGLSVSLPRPAWLRWPARPALLALVVIQFVTLIYDPRVVLPTQRDAAAGQALLQTIRSYPGEVFIPAHSYYTALAGKATYAHWAAITDTSGIWDTDLDVQHGGVNDPRRRIILDEISAAVARQQFDAILLDDIPKERRAYWDALLAPYYRLERPLFSGPDVFWTVSGAPKRPDLIYVPLR